ncbi:MAG: DUF3820 family protein [Candidatus Omnitrophica bacterium]|nr:DUF3820 family protein [Candidatus Omnitrophota bacterium]
MPDDLFNELYDEKYLLKIVRTKMPFGKYSGSYLIDLPERYILWFAQKGFPQGQLGVMLRSVYEIKLNGLEQLLRPLRPPKKGG